MRESTHNRPLLVALCVLFLFPTLVHAEKITHFNVDIEIHEDSSITVLETIDYDFEGGDRHGIYREIPLRYKTTAGNRGIDINVISVSKDGYSEPFKESTRNYVTKIRIGDADKYVSGPHTYRITYEVKGAIKGFENFDELYWNTTGHDWNVPIEQASVSITAPGKFAQTTCYQGVRGSTERCANENFDNRVYSAVANDIGYGKGMTVAVGIEKGVVALPTIFEKVWRYLKYNLIFLLPLFVLIFLYRKWDATGRDAKGTGTIIPQYEAPGRVTPLFMGSIVDGEVNSRDIAAGIVYLAEQGYIHITKDEKPNMFSAEDYTLTWVGNFDELNKKERLLVDLLFNASSVAPLKSEEMKLSALKKDKKAYLRKKKLEEHIDEELMAQGYFANKPEATRTSWMWGAFITGFLIFWGVGMFHISLDIPTIAALALSIIIWVGFGYAMPKMTKKGALAREHILGFKEFLEVTEKERLKFHNAPSVTTEEFMENLPYAIALGVEKEWAEQFKDLDMEEPDWYHDSKAGTFNSVVLGSALSDFGTAANSSVTQPSSNGSGSGGGGFSGGGGGGGGGGSW